MFLAARTLIGVASPVGLVTPLVRYLERQSAGDARNNVELAQKALEELRDTKDRSIVVPLMDVIPNMSSGAQIVMEVLGKVQPRSNGWTAMLVTQAARSDPAVRRQSMLLMRDVRVDADVAQWSPAAARLLSTDPDDVVRSYAASALQFAGGAASAHADAVLSAARRDRSAGVRESAFDALVEMIGRAGTAPMTVKTAMAKSALPMIQAAIDTDPEMDVRESAIDALDALSLEPAQSASLLVALAAKTTLPEGLRRLALSKLRNRGGEARSAAGDVKKLTGDSNSAVREMATEALERMTTDRTATTAARVGGDGAGTGPCGHGIGRGAETRPARRGARSLGDPRAQNRVCRRSVL